MSRDHDDEREAKFAQFQQDVAEEMNRPASASGDSDSEDAPYGVCFQNQMYNCGPACVAFLPFDVGPDDQPLRWGERCEILVSKRLQARALVNLERHISQLVPLAAKKQAPSATDGPAPPPSPAKG